MVRLNDRDSDRQCKPGSAGITAPRIVGAVERLEHARKLLGRNTETLVVDRDFNSNGSCMDGRACLLPGFDGVVEEISNCAPKCIWSAIMHDWSGRLPCDRH